jgi:hypothetical protein
MFRGGARGTGCKDLHKQEWFRNPVLDDNASLDFQKLYKY